MSMSLLEGVLEGTCTLDRFRDSVQAYGSLCLMVAYTLWPMPNGSLYLMAYA